MGSPRVARKNGLPATPASTEPATDQWLDSAPKIEKSGGVLSARPRGHHRVQAAKDDPVRPAVDQLQTPKPAGIVAFMPPPTPVPNLEEDRDAEADEDRRDRHGTFGDQPFGRRRRLLNEPEAEAAPPK